MRCDTDIVTGVQNAEWQVAATLWSVAMWGSGYAEETGKAALSRAGAAVLAGGSTWMECCIEEVGQCGLRFRGSRLAEVAV